MTMPSEDELYERLQERVTLLEGLMSMPEGEDESLYGVAQGYNHLRERLEVLELAATGSSSPRLLERLENHSARLVRSETNLSELAEKIKAMGRNRAEGVDVGKAYIKTNQEAHGILQERIERLEARTDPAELEPHDVSAYGLAQRLAALEDWRRNWTSPGADLGDSMLVNRLTVFEDTLNELKAMLRDGDTLDDIRTAIQTNSANLKALGRDICRLDNQQRDFDAAGAGQQKLSETVLERISCTQADMHKLKSTVSGLEGSIDGVEDAAESGRNALAERITDLEETLAEVARIRTTSADPKRPCPPFDPNERVNLLELQLTMSLVKPQNWTIKDFIGFVGVTSCHPAEAHVRRIERRQRGRTLVTINGSCLADDRMRVDITKRPFLLLGERAAAVGMIFERVSDTMVSLELTEIRRHGEER
jgi:DNA repair exonuclease SbcCD ATPase subunit